ncbi:hypothetical protein B566_EDAN009947 [Ephemera danica]|nr:hypothetical protein B566_EDAN009947 [Ephemera danica]
MSITPKPHFVGKRFKQISSENFDGYMGKLEVNFVLRKMGNRVKTLTVFNLDDDGTWTLHIDSIITTFKLEGNTLIQEQRGGKYTTVVRTFEGDIMTAVMTCEDVVATIVGKALEK